MRGIGLSSGFGGGAVCAGYLLSIGSAWFDQPVAAAIYFAGAVIAHALRDRP
jgi:hypothetical protein